VPRKERLWIAHLIFWSVLLVSLAVSIYLGLNSTWAWYLERTSFKMYEAMLLSAVILLAFVCIAGQVHIKRLQHRESSLRNRLALLEIVGVNDVDILGVLGGIEETETKRRSFWVAISPLILMVVLFFFLSVFALVELSPYLVENYKINTVFVLFVGSCSKIVIGLESVVLYKSVVL